MTTQTIKSIAGATLHECEADSTWKAVEHAVRKNVNLSYADLRYADLCYADLRNAYLRDANLWSTCLAVPPDRHEWCMGNCLARRTIDYRILCLTTRTATQPHMNGPNYEIGRLYVAPIFSSCPTTTCHPGLYLAGKGEALMVAFWMDRLHLAGNKARVPEFRTVASVEEFEALTAEDMVPNKETNDDV